ncbi:MAG TPA: hypothetical protein VJ124_11420 [Pyrinomonadaceae bacterium]|nr:hypothetical protein [Pyrinomonadaceae bacterium]
MLAGRWCNSTRPVMDIPHLITLYQAGELKLRELVTHTPTISTASTTRWQRWPLAKVRAASSVVDTVALACFVILLPATSEA